MRYAIEESADGFTRRDQVSDYQVKLYKELRSLARLGIPARRTGESGLLHPALAREATVAAED